MRQSDELVCDKVKVLNSGFVDIPDVVVDKENLGVGICASSAWARLGELSSLFVGIMSHESVHLTLLKIDGNSSDFLDNVASLSTITDSLDDIGLVRRYKDGMIGLNLKKMKEGEPASSS